MFNILGINAKLKYIPKTERGSILTFIDGGIKGDQRIIKINYGRFITAGDFIKFDLYFEAEFGKKIDVQINNNESPILRQL